MNQTNESYVSEFTLRRHSLQKRENQKLLERIEVDNQEGVVLPLSEIAKHSPSNPLVRRAEMMNCTRGFENIANASSIKHQALFITLTCPSSFHACLTSGFPNPKYNGSTVSEAQAHLNTVWSRTRASFDRRDIDVFGTRVVEPHHDGTPHWHLLLFLPESQADLACQLFKHYALEVDGDEPGAEVHRLKIVKIDPSKGSATGYIAKYIGKNIDGHLVDKDHYGLDGVKAAIRIGAWASIHGIRQFDHIGGPSKTVWRELRRLSTQDVDQGLLKQLIEAADNSDWATYSDLMGGVNCPRKQRPLRPMMIERRKKNRYGEKVKIIKGLWFGALSVLTRPFEWVSRVRLGLDSPTQESEDGVGFGAALCTAPPGACSTLEFCQ